MTGPMGRGSDGRGSLPVGTSALRPNRRGMVQALACWSLAGIGLAPIGSVRACQAAIPPAALTEIFGDTIALRLLGLLYLQNHAKDADPQRLHRALFNGATPQTAAQIAQSLATRRAQDLAAEDIAIVGGWLLTRGEAQLCALVALTAATT
jgi:hypothetical protein